MNKRLLVLLGGVFALGWLLSLIYYDAPPESVGPDSADSAALPRTPVEVSSQASSADAGNAPRESEVENPPEQSASLLEVTLERLGRGEFEAVMAEYLETQSQLSESDALEHKGIILDHARSLLESDQSADAEALLNLYLDYEFRDVSAMLLMAEIYQAGGNDLEAIEILFQAKSYAYFPELIEETDQVLRLTIRDYDSQLLDRNDYIARLNLYQRLTELEPEYTLHFIELAETYLALGNAVDAREALALTRHDSSVLARVNDIDRRIDKSLATDKQYAAGIALQPFGNQFLVGAVVNNAHRAFLLLDTGASLSIISAGSLQAMGVAYQSSGRTAWFNTAGGRVQAPVVTLDSLALDNMVVEDIEVGVISELDGAPFDGLLGMNYLRHFEFFIDQNQSRLQLTPHR